MPNNLSLILQIFVIFIILSFWISIRPWKPTKRARDITQFYYKFLGEDLVKMADETFKAMIIGKPRAGKTATAADTLDHLLSLYPDRELCLFRGSEQLLEAFKNAFRDYGLTEWVPRVYRTARLNEIRNYSICYCDEAITTMSAKEALLVENRGLGKALTYASHKGVIFIICAQDDGVIKDFRTKMDLVIYKRLSPEYIRDSEDPWVRIFAKRLEFCPHEKGLLRSSVFGLEKVGVLTTPLVPWWSNELSKNLAGVGLDSELNREMEVRSIEDDVAKQMLETFGPKRAKKSQFSRLIAGYLLRNDPETYFLMERRLGRIASKCLYDAELKLMEEPEDGESDLNMDCSSIVLEKGENFAQYCQKWYLSQYDDDHGALMILWFLQGIPQENIAKKVTKSIKWVNAWLKQFRETNMGYLFEQYWFSTHPNGKLGGGNTNEPDYIDNQGIAWSLKCRYGTQKSFTFYQDSDDKKNGFGPEYRYSKENGMPSYYVALFNVLWGGDVIITEIDPEGENKVNISNPKASKKKGKN